MLAAGLTVWLASVAEPQAVWPVVCLGAVATAGLLVTLAVGRAEPLAGVLVLLGAAYAVILVLDDPPLDTRAAIVGAAMPAIGELAYLSVEARTAVAEEAGAVARRIGVVTVLVLLALSLGGPLVTLVDLLRTGGLRMEIVGAAAAVGAVGLLVRAASEARREDEHHRSG